MPDTNPSSIPPDFGNDWRVIDTQLFRQEQIKMIFDRLNVVFFADVAIGTVILVLFLSLGADASSFI